MTSQQKFFQLLEKSYINSKTIFDELDAMLYGEGIQKTVGFDRAVEALFSIARVKGFGRVPTVQEILTAAGHQEDLTSEEEANLLADQIFKAASRFGQYRIGEAAKALGPKGWGVAGDMWEEICMSEVDNRTTLRAQLRKSLMAHSANEKVKESHVQLEEGKFDALKFIKESMDG